MTYPPQNPGPYGTNPYGEQQPQQPPGGWQQQQPGGWQQQPQQQPGYGYGQQPTQGFGGYPPQPPKRTGLIVGLVVAGVLVVGGGATAIVLLSNSSSSDSGSSAGPSDTPKDSPDDLVNKVITAVEAKDAQAAQGLLCEPSSSSPAFELDKAPKDITIKATLTGKVTQTGTSANARVNLKVTEPTTSRSTTVPLTLRMAQKQGKWCVENATIGSSSGGSSRPSTPRTSY